MIPPCVIFDLDGTLADTADDVADIFNTLLRGLGRRQITRDEVIACFGLGAGRFAERAVALTGPALPAAEHAILLDNFTQRYNTAPPVHARLYAGARLALSACRQAGWRVGLCTNKPFDASMLVLKHLGIAGFFHGVSGGDSAPVRKPDPGHVLDAIVRAGGEPGCAVLVGDSETDIEAGAAASVPVVLVAGGYHHGGGRGADYTIGSLADLPAVLHGIFIPVSG